MSSVPEEIYLEILLRVPVKSTFVCKCVCKSWLQIISNPNFVKMHLNITTQKENYNLMFGRYVKTESWNWTVSCVSHDSLWSIDGSVREIFQIADYPFSPGNWPPRFLGSCNGLVCIWCGTKVEYSIYIFNPATREYKRIKSKSQDCFLFSIYAFGYDCKADDYKLITVEKPWEQSFGTRSLDVYTLGTNLWKRSQSVPYTFPNILQNGILVNGAFHWFCEASEKNLSKLIISLDISNEKFNELQLPKELSEKKHLSMTVGVLEGYLCVLGTASHCFEVWMMQDYGDQESWTQRYIIGRESTVDNYDSRLICSLKNAQILLKNGLKLVIYDPKQSNLRAPKIFSNLGFIDAITYVESLVSLN